MTTGRMEVPAKSRVARQQILVKDSPITNELDDSLGHTDVSVMLLRVLQDWMEEPAPLHIALYGPWGSGKSGVISLLKAQITADVALAAQVRVIDFSLWRFGAENVRRGLLLFLDSEEGFGTRLDISKRLSQASAHAEVQTKIRWGRLFAWFTVATVMMLVGITLEVYLGASKAWAHVFAQIANGMAVLTAIAAIMKQLAGNTLTAQVTEGSSTAPPDRPDQFRAEFEKILSAARGAKLPPWSEPKKLVLVLDDLDRVPPSIAWEVLTTIKTFMDARHCIYIVPCDRQAVVEAIGKSSGPSIEARALDFLDKFFQVSFTLPEPYPRELRKISVALSKSLDLPDEVTTVAVAGFHHTPRALKIFLNQISLISQFLQIRNARLAGENGPSILGKVAKVHAIRTLWPKCGQAIAEISAFMSLLEDAAQGLESEPSDARSLRDGTFLSPRHADFCRGLREFLVATLGIAVGADGQSVAKLSEAMWRESEGDLSNIRIYLSTGDREALRNTFLRGDVTAAVDVARDAFEDSAQSASAESLIGWTGVLLDTFFTSEVAIEPALVGLALEWLSTSQVGAALTKMPPGPVIRCASMADDWRALSIVNRLVDTCFATASDPLQPLGSSILKAISEHGASLAARHLNAAHNIQSKLVELIGTNRNVALLMLQVMDESASPEDWKLWWSSRVGEKLIDSFAGAGPEDAQIVHYAARRGYQPTAEERRASVRVACRLFERNTSGSPDAATIEAYHLVTRIALTGQESVRLLSRNEVGLFSRFLSTLQNSAERLKYLTLGVRMLHSAEGDAIELFRTAALAPAMPHFDGSALEAVLSVVVESDLAAQEGWAGHFLARAIELRDAELFARVAKKMNNEPATALAFKEALPIDEGFADRLAPAIQPLLTPEAFGEVLEARLTRAQSDVGASLRIVVLLQSLGEKPSLPDANWHSLAMRLEQGIGDDADPTNAANLRTALRADLLRWLPFADAAHLADYATAVATSVTATPNEAPEKLQAKIETAGILGQIADERQQKFIANGIAHVLARPSLPPTVVSALIRVLFGLSTKAEELIGKNEWDAIALTRDARNDEGRSFLDELLSKRPPGSLHEKAANKKKSK